MYNIVQETVISSTLRLPSHLYHIQVGSLCILITKFIHCNPAQVFETLKKYNVTTVTGSPAFVEKLALHALKHNTTLPVRYTAVGGAPVFRGALRTISSATPDRNTVVVYGSTEVEPISCIYAAEKMDLEASLPDGHCVGKPVFKGSAKVIKILSGWFVISRDHYIIFSIDIVHVNLSITSLQKHPRSWSQ